MSATAIANGALFTRKSDQVSTTTADRFSFASDSSMISRRPALSTVSNTGEGCDLSKTANLPTPETLRKSSVDAKGSGV